MTMRAAALQMPPVSHSASHRPGAILAHVTYRSGDGRTVPADSVGGPNCSKPHTSGSVRRSLRTGRHWVSQVQHG
jgi:hypothetical protein